MQGQRCWAASRSCRRQHRRQGSCLLGSRLLRRLLRSGCSSRGGSCNGGLSRLLALIWIGWACALLLLHRAQISTPREPQGARCREALPLSTLNACSAAAGEGLMRQVWQRQKAFAGTCKLLGPGRGC